MKKTSSFTITYKGKGFSLNDLYQQGHWSKRHNLKKKYEDIFIDLIQKKKVYKFSDPFRLYVTYNSRHDVDNVIGMAKVFIDTLKGDYIPEDDIRYYKGVQVVYNKELPVNTFKFKITRWLQNQN